MINFRILNNLIKLSKNNLNKIQIKIKDITKNIIEIQKIITDIDSEIKKEKKFFSEINTENISIIAEIKDNFIEIEFNKQKQALQKMIILYKQLETLQTELFNEYQTLKKYELIKQKQQEEQKSQLELLQANLLSENINSKIANED